jgi:hypothetical protein
MKGAFLILVVLLISCLSTNRIGESMNKTSDNITGRAIPEQVIDEKLESQWVMINLTAVEKYCLREAKSFAMGQGYPSWVVSSCNCAENKSETEKSYGCSISAVDGFHYSDISCFKSGGFCIIETEAGITNYSFDQLEDLG